MADNPWAIMADPEFIKLNPGLARPAQEAGAALLSLSNSSDIIEQLTAYIAQDKDAMAFINGKADPWGMKVNPSYKKIKLPLAEWPLLDNYIPKTGSTSAGRRTRTVYFNNLAAPVTTLRKVSDALLDGWPNMQTRCDTDTSTDPPTYKLGRVDRQPYGTRFMLGVVSLGDAARYGLRTAALETKKGTYVAPTDTSLAAALKLSTQKTKYGPFVLDQADVRKSRHGLPRHDGRLHRGAAAEPGPGRRDQGRAVHPGLDDRGPAAGFRQRRAARGLPADREDGGRRRRYYASAQEVAAAVAAQKEPTDEPTDGPRLRRAGDGDGGGGSVTPPAAAPDRRRRRRPRRARRRRRRRRRRPRRCRPPRRSAPTSPAGCCPLLILLGADRLRRPPR